MFVDVYGDDGMDWDIGEKFRWRRDKRACYEVRTKGGHRLEKKVGEVMQITGEIGNKADDYDIVNAVKHVDEDNKLEEPEALMKKKEKDREENDDDDPERFGSEAMEVTEDWSVVMEAVGYVEKCIITKSVGEEAKMIIEVPLKPERNGRRDSWKLRTMTSRCDRQLSIVMTSEEVSRCAVEEVVAEDPDLKVADGESRWKVMMWIGIERLRGEDRRGEWLRQSGGDCGEDRRGEWQRQSCGDCDEDRG